MPPILPLLVVLAHCYTAERQETVQYYVDLLTEADKNARTYQFSPDANEYYADTKTKKYGTFDFVIIGGGAGGTVAANRLSENKKWKVLVLEAGHYGSNLTDVLAASTLVQFSHYNWGYNSTPQETACLGMENRLCHFPRGRGMGGSTLINGVVWARGFKYDYDYIAKIAGNDRWSYKSALKYFKKIENFVRNDPQSPVDPAYHGIGGPVRIEFHLPRHPLLEVFLKANEEIGYSITDYNANKMGAGAQQHCTRNGRRVDTYKAFIAPVKNRKNLKILTGSYVTRIQINKKTKRAVGVKFTNRGTNYYVTARKEVILCAGTLISPQILMLSGIGPKKHLEDLGIEVVQDLAVGDNLRDNPAFYGLSFSTNYTKRNKPLDEEVREFLNGVGPLTKSGTDGLGFYESSLSKGTGVPDVELEIITTPSLDALSQRYFMMTDQTYEDVWKFNDASHTFLLHVDGLHARSKGTIRLRSKNPFDYPLIDPRFLSHPDDMTIMYDGIQLALKLMQMPSFKAIETKLQTRHLKACRNHKYLSRDYWYCALRQVTLNLYHPSGTCSIGTDPKRGAVVNSELKVFGIKGLRVADASVIPLSIAGHTLAITLMVGEQLGDLVKLEHEGRLK